MPTPSSLLLNGEPMSSPAPLTLYERILGEVATIESKPLRNFEVDAQTVYVFQREFAAVPRSLGLTLGSDRATTCHLLAAHSQSKAFLAHLDGARGQMLALLHALRDTFAEHTNAVDVHLVGGFRDDRGESLRLGMEILATLQNAGDFWPGVVFHLRACTVGANNTTAENGIVAPSIRGLAVRTNTMELVPNAWFPDPQPFRWERAALAFTGRMPLASVYDASTASYRIDRDWLLPQSNDMLRYLLSIRNDAELLKMTSSSPFAEHTEYCEEMRALMRFLADRKPIE